MEAVILEEVAHLSSGDFNRLLEENPGHLFFLILILILMDDSDTIHLFSLVLNKCLYNSDTIRYISYMLISVLTDSNKGGVVRDPG